LNQSIAGLINQGENVYLVDSIPISVYQIAREKSCKVCKEDYETAPDKGYSTVGNSAVTEPLIPG